jgi:hypothetical protein
MAGKYTIQERVFMVKKFYKQQSPEFVRIEFVKVFELKPNEGQQGRQ